MQSYDSFLSSTGFQKLIPPSQQPDRWDAAGSEQAPALGGSFARGSSTLPPPAESIPNAARSRGHASALETHVGAAPSHPIPTEVVPVAPPLPPSYPPTKYAVAPAAPPIVAQRPRRPSFKPLSADSRFMGRAEKLVAGAGGNVALYVFVAISLVAGFLWLHRRSALWGAIALAGAVGAGGALVRVRRESGADPDAQALRAPEPREGSVAVMPDTDDDLAHRLAMTGLSAAAQREVEGPRGKYTYRRARNPLPRPDQSSAMPGGTSTMSPEDYHEYVARLGGELPEQTHKRYPYTPFAAQWDGRASVDDGERRHGISTAPDRFNRHYPYREPKVNQAGAALSHLKDPAPGSLEPLDKRHPWMEPSAERAMAMDASVLHQGGGQATEYAQAVADSAAFITEFPMQTKITADHASELAAERERADLALFGPPRPPSQLPMQQQQPQQQQQQQPVPQSPYAPQLRAPAPVATVAQVGPQDSFESAFRIAAPSEEAIREATTGQRRRQ